MNIVYIKEMNECNEISQNYFMQKIKKIFNIITIKEIENKKIYILPIENKKKNVNKLANKLSKILYNNNYKCIVISNYLNAKEEFKNKLYSNNINILDGRWLFNYLVYDAVEEICNLQKKQIEFQEISILVNDNSDINLKNIIELAQKVKMLNIITNNINKFRKIEEYLYNSLGIMVRISNNTKKALLRTNIIVNIDFPEEIINKYTIPRNAVVLNINDNINIHTKKFSGININYYKILLPSEYIEKFRENKLYDKFESNLLYESILYNKSSYESIRKQIKENNIKILEFYGKNGVIDSKEFKSS